MFFKSAVITLFLVSLTACTSLSPAGLIAVSRLDPLSTPPSDIAVAVGVPDTVKLTNGDAVFALSFTPATASEPAISETVPLQLRSDQATGPSPSSSDETVYVAGFSEADARKVATAQARIKSMKDNDIDGQGSLSIAVVGGCVTTPDLTELPVSTWLQTAPDAAFVRLTRTQDMLAQLPVDEAQAFKANLKPCS